jgi:AraC family transcriptional regulator
MIHSMENMRYGGAMPRPQTNEVRTVTEEPFMKPMLLPSAVELFRAMSYIHAHLRERVSVDDIARAAGVDARRFTRLFKKMAGVPPRWYLTQARVELAKELMRSSEKNLTQIAAEAGFLDQSHMTNVFRRHAGMTPTAFRKS